MFAFGTAWGRGSGGRCGCHVVVGPGRGRERSRVDVVLMDTGEDLKVTGKD